MTRIGKGSGSDKRGLGSGDSFFSTPAYQEIPHDPYIDIQQPVNDGWNFHNYSKLITWGLAKDWFADLESIPALEYLRQHSGNAAADSVRELWGKQNWFEHASIYPKMLMSSGQFGTLMPITAGNLTTQLIEFFKSRGVISHEFAMTYRDKRVSESSNQMLWIAPFETSFGTRCFIAMESHRDQFGVERCHIFTNLLINSRMPSRSSINWTINDLNLNFFTPIALTRLAYLAETPFPSSIASMSRPIAFSGVPADLIPNPVISIENYSVAFTHFPKIDSIGFEIDIYPQVMRLGYEITSNIMDHIEEIIPACVDILVQACSIVEDGFRNYRNPDKPESFDFNFLSEAILDNEKYVEGRSTGGLARWIPESHLSTLKYSTVQFMAHAYSAEGENDRRKICQWVADEGIGSVAVASAINTLAYSYLIPEKDYEKAIWYLKQAVNLEAVNESTNAMANLGAVYLNMGQPEEAIYWLTTALGRDDKFAETEACLLLGKHFLEQRKKMEAIEYLKRGANGPADRFSTQCQELLKQLIS